MKEPLSSQTWQSIDVQKLKSVFAWDFSVIRQIGNRLNDSILARVTEISIERKTSLKWRLYEDWLIYESLRVIHVGVPLHLGLVSLGVQVLQVFYESLFFTLYRHFYNLGLLWRVLRTNIIDSHDLGEGNRVRDDSFVSKIAFLKKWIWNVEAEGQINLGPLIQIIKSWQLQGVVVITLYHFGRCYRYFPESIML